MTKGPLLRPQGVIITGKAFGNGIYFAPRAKKSIGYSSLRGAYWTGGMQNKGYLAVYKVLFKNQKDVNVSYPYSLSNIRPHDAVYAHKGVILQNDKYPYGKPQTDEVARGSGNREYGCRRLREKLPNFSGVSFFRAGNSSNRVNAFHICVYVHLCVVPRYIASQHP